MRGSVSVPIDEATAEGIWRKDVAYILRKVGKCEHERVAPKCPKDFTSSACTYRWAVTECLVVDGEMTLIANELETELKIPIQLGKVTFKENGLEKSVAGLLVSYENSRRPIGVTMQYIQMNC